MNRPVHLTAGAMVGGAVYLGACKLLDHPLDLGGLCLAALLGAGARAVHDLLEPAIHPNYRGLMHSAAVTVAAIAGMACSISWFSRRNHHRY